MTIGTNMNEATTGVLTAQAILAELQTRAIRIEAQGNRLRYSPRSAMTDDLCIAIVERKPELLALLTGVCITCGTKNEPALLNGRCSRCVAMLRELPAYGCEECAGRRWWRPRYGGGWRCGECHLADANSVWFCEVDQV